MLELVKQAKIGSIVPVYKEINEELNALDYFAKLSDYGRKKNSVLFEDNDKSFGSANPCLIVSGKGSNFEVTALNNLGKKILSFIKKDFAFCDKAVYRRDKIFGTLTAASLNADERQKLKSDTHLGILRAIAFKFNLRANPFSPCCSLFGMVSYDFINQMENIPNSSKDMLNDPDYIFYFLDNMFMADHKAKKTYFIANAVITDNSKEKIWQECGRTIGNYENIISKKTPKAKKCKKRELKLDYGAEKGELLSLMKDLKKDIIDGGILCATPSIMIAANCNAEPLDIYAKIRNSEQKNNLCYINDKNGVFIGYGLKAILSVSDSERLVELRVSTAAKPRAITKNGIENDLDNKYEALLKADENEISYSTIIVDAIRNDLARVSKPGTRYVDNMLTVSKQNNFQDIVSSVKGNLREGLDALHAFSATINPPIISGYPKIKSAGIIGKLEKEKRGFTSASVLNITPDKCLQSIAMEPIRIKKDKAYFRISCRVFYNSDDTNELKANNDKFIKLLDSINAAGGKK